MRYAKRLGGEPITYRLAHSAEGVEGPFDLWVTLGDMDLDDALRLRLPAERTATTVGDLFHKLFPSDCAGQPAAPALLDVKANPDAPEMYLALAQIFREWHSGRCSLRFFLDYGPELSLSEPVAELLKVPDRGREAGAVGPVLDVVIEQRYRPIDYAVERGYAASKADLLTWLRESALLFLLWHTEPIDLRSELASTADELSRLGLAERLDGGVYGVTERGQRHVGGLLEEARSYIREFDVFRDLLHDSESGSVHFGTGGGVDLRVQVWESEGVDPVRAVFLLRLHDAVSDSDSLDWTPAALNDEFFVALLEPVVDRDEVDAKYLESIIEAGLAATEERDEEAATASSEQGIVRRGAAAGTSS